MQPAGSSGDAAKPAGKPLAGAGLQATVNARPFVPGGGGARPHSGSDVGTSASPGVSPGNRAVPAAKGGASPLGGTPGAGPAGAGGVAAAAAGGAAAAAAAAAAKMSASASSFVPRGGGGGGGGAATAAPPGASPPGLGAAPMSPQHPPGSKGLTAPLRSPGATKARGPPGLTPFPSAAPGGRGPPGRGGGRGGRGGRGGGGLPYGVLPFGAAPGPLPPGLDLDAPHSGRASSGGGGGGGGLASSSRNGGLLAQQGGGYASAHGAYSAGPGRNLLAAQFMAEGLRQQLQQFNYLIQSQWAPGPDDPALPDMLGQYHSLYPLEDLLAAEEHPSPALGVRSCVIKGLSPLDGAAYALRRVDGKQVLPSSELLTSARAAMDAWSAVAGHPGLSAPRDVFVAADLDGAPALVFAHPYHPGAVTVAQAHLMPTQTASGQLVRNTPNEAVLWSYIAQLSAALRAAHAAGLAVRPPALSPSKVLVLPLGRLRVGGLGVAEALAGDVRLGQEDLVQAQREDVVAMGQLLLTLACSPGGMAPPSLEFATAHYSPDLVRCLALLLGAGEGGAFSWRHLVALVGERLMAEVDSLAIMNDHLVADLGREVENGRLLRLLVKLGFVNERPEGDAMSQWSETGDRYLLKLFRDFVFHQAEADGAPRLDWGHVVECLNKLDAGVPEQVLLMSRDEQSMLVASYGDIKRCVESAYTELRSAARPAGR